VVRQLVTESLLLASIAGAAGLGLGAALHRLLRQLAFVEDPSAALPLEWNWRLWAFALALSTMAGIATGLYSALRLARLDTSALLKGGRVTSSGWRKGPQRLVLVMQIGGAVALLAGAGLLVRSLTNLRNASTRLQRTDALLVSVDPAGSQRIDRPSGSTKSVPAFWRPSVSPCSQAASSTIGTAWGPHIWRS
jgi:macrolide transport system ATP-binding/permease protein